eukprot:3506-Chlamydomonas_euryale.AAC.1
MSHSHDTAHTPAIPATHAAPQELVAQTVDASGAKAFVTEDVLQCLRKVWLCGIAWDSTATRSNGCTFWGGGDSTTTVGAARVLRFATSILTPSRKDRSPAAGRTLKKVCTTPAGPATVSATLSLRVRPAEAEA